MVFCFLFFFTKGVTLPTLCFRKIGQSVVSEVDCGGGERDCRENVGNPFAGEQA